MPDPLYPDPAAPRRLLAEVRGLLEMLPYVVEVLVFGSLATVTADRWSDLDVIVVTENRAQFRLAFEHLRAAKTIRYHSPFTLNADGGVVLGSVFADEAIFHVLDLNFFTHADRQLLGVLDRFGPVRELCRCPSPAHDAPDSQPTTGDPLDPEEERIYIAIHFTKKALKRWLRGSGDSEKLRHHLARLETVLDDYPPDFTTPNGEMGYVAQTYRELAQRTLSELPT